MPDARQRGRANTRRGSARERTSASRANRRLPTALRLLAEPGERLEAAPEHPLAVEGHLRRIHLLLELRVVHHGLADAIAVLLVAIHDPGHRDDFVVLELNGLRERRDLSRLDVVTDRIREV